MGLLTQAQLWCPELQLRHGNPVAPQLLIWTHRKALLPEAFTETNPGHPGPDCLQGVRGHTQGSSV